jgi:hypothetical protein
LNFVRSGQWFLPRSVDSLLGLTRVFPPTSDPGKLNLARGTGPTHPTRSSSDSSSVTSPV